MTWPESVDEALCHGWIDGVRKRIDNDTYQIWLTPRKPISIWSAVNIAKYEKLLAQGRITPAGVRAYAPRAAERSLVCSYEQAETAMLSDPETRAFQRNKAVWQFWQTTPPGYRKTALHYIGSAKRAETRATRLAKLTELCAEGLRW